MKIKLFIFIVLITFPSLSFANANSEKLIQELSKWSFNKKETVKNSIKLIKSGADVNFQRKRNGDTPLILASSKGLYEVVKVLLKKGAKINESNNEGMNPIIATAYIGVTQGRLNKADKKKVKDREKVLKLLIKNKANLNYQVYDNSNFGYQFGSWTALMFACRFERGNMAQILIKAGAKLNLINKTGGSALLIASYFGRKKIIKSLIKAKANLDFTTEKVKNITPLMYSTQNGFMDIIKLMIKKGAKVNALDSRGNSPLLFALRTRLIAKKGFFGLGVKASEVKKLRKKFFKICQILLKAGAKLNIKNKNQENPFSLAVTNGHYQFALWMIKNKKISTEELRKENSSFIQAIKAKHHKLMNLILNSGVDVNKVFVDGYKRPMLSPLQLSIQNKLHKFTQKLLEKGAEVSFVSKGKESPIFQAVRGNNLKDLKLLIKNGAKLNQVNSNGLNVLHILCRERIKNPEITKLLIENKIHLKLKARFYGTPLEACKSGRLKKSVKLIEAALKK